MKEFACEISLSASRVDDDLYTQANCLGSRRFGEKQILRPRPIDEDLSMGIPPLTPLCGAPNARVLQDDTGWVAGRAFPGLNHPIDEDCRWGPR